MIAERRRYRLKQRLKNTASGSGKAVPGEDYTSKPQTGPAKSRRSAAPITTEHITGGGTKVERGIINRARGIFLWASADRQLRTKVSLKDKRRSAPHA